MVVSFLVEKLIFGAEDAGFEFLVHVAKGDYHVVALNLDIDGWRSAGENRQQCDDSDISVEFWLFVLHGVQAATGMGLPSGSRYWTVTVPASSEIRVCSRSRLTLRFSGSDSHLMKSQLPDAVGLF